MNETQSVALAGYRRPLSKPASAESGARAETKSRVWPGLRISVHSDLAGVEAAWRNLEERAPATVFQSFDYLSVWFRNVGIRENVTPAIVVLRSADELVAVFPLAVSRGGFSRRLTWLGQDLCDYLLPLAAREFSQLPATRFRALWQEIVAHLQTQPPFRHDWIEFRRMPAELRGSANPVVSLATIRHASDAHISHLTAPWDEFHRTRRNGKARKQDRSKLARLREFGAVELVSPDRTDEIVRTIDALIEQKRETFRRKGIPDLFARPGVREFFIDLATSPRTRAVTHVSALTAGPSLAATSFAMEYGKRYSLMLVSYDNSFARLSPGVIQLGRLIERAIDRGVEEFDFLVGEQRLKSEWADREIPLYDYIAATTWTGLLHALPARAAAKLKRSIKQNPALWSAFQRLRSIAGALRPQRG